MASSEASGLVVSAGTVLKDAARVVLELGMHQTCTENMESCIVSWKNGIECPGEIICTRKGENAGRLDELEYARSSIIG